MIELLTILWKSIQLISVNIDNILIRNYIYYMLNINGFVNINNKQLKITT